ncbi:hypothetical protein OPIT5_00020 (plasmid) [Opitutaceae bacterium TAV5]|nr:hypothetical protein OPIT5_00020 [Opitutaceae bacterium TAV5]
MNTDIELFVNDDESIAVLVYDLHIPLRPFIYGLRGILDARETARYVVAEHTRRSADRGSAGRPPSWEEMACEGDYRMLKFEAFLNEVQKQLLAANVFAGIFGDKIRDTDSYWIKAAALGVLPAYASAIHAIRRAAPDGTMAMDAEDFFSSESLDADISNSDMALLAWRSAETVGFSLQDRRNLVPLDLGENRKLIELLAPWWAQNGSHLRGAAAPQGEWFESLSAAKRVSTAEAFNSIKDLESRLAADGRAGMIPDVIGYSDEWKWLWCAAMNLEREALAVSARSAPAIALHLAERQSRLNGPGQNPGGNAASLPVQRVGNRLKR